MIFILNTAIMLLTLVSPLIAIYAVSYIKKGNVAKHVKIHKILFATCMVALVLLETQIRFSGGSGSIVKHSEYYGTPTFKIILVAHIIGAVLTYLIWAVTIVTTNLKFKRNKRLEKGFSKTHRILGITTIIGLLYTAITALLVYLMTFIL
ncbi:MAG TPA: DUF420 domain-containing protein [Crocinitomicaceae bacterium]|jgi:putative membrane protein|nr:DUF420 domain-containing protein [Crocinitomicaceae bacterium]